VFASSVRRIIILFYHAQFGRFWFNYPCLPGPLVHRTKRRISFDIKARAKSIWLNEILLFCGWRCYKAFDHRPWVILGATDINARIEELILKLLYVKPTHYCGAILILQLNLPWHSPLGRGRFFFFGNRNIFTTLNSKTSE